MEQWTMHIVNNLLSEHIEYTDERYTNGSCLVSAITVLCIMSRTASLNQLSEEHCSAMACLFRESYRPSKMTCPAYDVLNQHLTTEDFRYKIVCTHA